MLTHELEPVQETKAERFDAEWCFQTRRATLSVGGVIIESVGPAYQEPKTQFVLADFKVDEKVVTAKIRHVWWDLCQADKHLEGHDKERKR